MSALAEQILANINARVEAAIFGPRTDGAHCAVASGSVFRMRDLERSTAKLAKLPNPCVGMVCRPDTVGRVRQLAEAEAHPLLGPLPVYEKCDQPEACLAFYDHAELKRHLSPNTKISQPQGKRNRSKSHERKTRNQRSGTDVRLGCGDLFGSVSSGDNLAGWKRTLAMGRRHGRMDSARGANR